MFIIWSGWGFLTIPIVGVVSIVVGVIANLAFAATGSPPQSIVMAADLGLFAGAAANWYIGKRLNNVPGRELLDPATGERILLTRRHKLFWIQMQYWSIPVAVLGLGYLLIMLVAMIA